MGIGKDSLTCWTPPLHLPLYGGASPSVYIPHSFIDFPVHWYIFGISMLYGEYFPYVGDLGGVSPSVGGLGASAIGAMLILVHSCRSLCLTFLLWL